MPLSRAGRKTDGTINSSRHQNRKKKKKPRLPSGRSPRARALLLLVVATLRGPPAAVLAFGHPAASKPRPSHLPPLLSRPLASATGGSLSLSATEGGGTLEVGGPPDDAPRREGRTGWPHNRPRSPDSAFWSEEGERRETPGAEEEEEGGSSPPPGEEAKKKKKEAEEERREEAAEPRTGWLHNTAPPAERQKAASAAAEAGSDAPADGRGGRESPARRLLRLEVGRMTRNHRILYPPTFHPCGDGRRIAVTEHKISVPLKRPPLDAGNGDDAVMGGGGGDAARFAPGEGLLLSMPEGSEDSGPRIDVYFAVAELVEKEEDERFFSSAPMGLAPGEPNDVRAQRRRADAYVSRANLTDAESLILYLQGGPGFGAPPPVSGLSLAAKGSWAGEALSSSSGSGFKRVVLMDQRGTGRSTPVTKQTLERKFPDLFALDDMARRTGGAFRESTGASASFNEDDLLGRGGDDGGGGEGGGDGEGWRIAEQLDKWEALNPDLAAKVGVGLGQAAEYVACFRADSIVRDAEDVKDALLQPLDEEGGEKKKARPYGAVLGQSFGGFCAMTYLSFVPDPPRICLLTGGIAPMLTPPFEVYDRLWDRVRERNLRYYEAYPGDVDLVKRIVRRLLDNRSGPATLPGGGILTARRFLQLGLGLGGSPSAFASLHDLLTSAFVDPDASSSDEGGKPPEFSRPFLRRIDATQPFDDHPLYYLLHESIYADGDRPGHGPTDWAAHRALRSRSSSSPADPRPPSEFDHRVTSHPSDSRPTLFFGEMVFPWMADGDYAELSGFGMRALARSLAAKDDWGPLYDAGRMRRALAAPPAGGPAGGGGGSRAAAAVYHDDMYVDFDCSMRVAARGGPLEGCKVWVTNEYQHSGLRDDGAAVFAKLLGMARGSVGTPS